MKKSLVALLIACTGLSAQEPLPPAKRSDGINSSGGKILPQQAAYDVLHYDLALTVDPDQRTIEGTVTVTARVVKPFRYLLLDLADPLLVTEARAKDRKLLFRQGNGMISIDLGKSVPRNRTIRIAVDYGGKPRSAPRAPWERVSGLS